jgi:hypothetical protein
MSSDKRPAKVRVFSSSSGSMPGQRRDDVEATPPEVEAPPAIIAAEPARSGGFILLACLFVLGCALGGALFAIFGLIPGAAL